MALGYDGGRWQRLGLRFARRRQQSQCDERQASTVNRRALHKRECIAAIALQQF